jgi:tetratricopeptide (TPR) repeat protein
MKRMLYLIILIFLLSTTLFSEDKNLLSINAVPYGSVPLGSSADIFNFGYGIDVSASYMPASFKYFGARLGSNFILLPLESADSIWVLSGSAGPVFILPIGDKLELSVHGIIGYYYFNTAGWDAADGTGGDLIFSGGAGGTFKITNEFSLGLGVSYDYYSSLYNGVGISLSAQMDFPLAVRERPVQEVKPKEIVPQLLDEKGKGLELRDITMAPLFPVLYKYYDSNPVGSVRVKNFENKAAEDIKIQFFVERYMDNPMEIGDSFNLEPGEEKIIELFGLFTQDMMEITEGTKASAKITLSYTMNGNSGIIDYTPVLEVYNRNALMWDDDRKIASFVTAKDPEILGFAKNVMTWMQDVKNPAVDENLQKGMSIFEAVKSYGIRYEIDPATPFADLSSQETAIDFLQFPRQTLQYTNGDCDDLTSLYTSLLEAVGVETAVITIPGHIYAAFALKASPDEARRTFSRPDELVIMEDRAWVPIEITMFQESFEKAWQMGAKEWRENNSREQSLLYPTRESWKLYQAVGFREGSAIQLPDRGKVTTAFTKTLTRYVEQEIYPQVAQIQSQMQQSSSEYKYKNRLAVLYARYGLYDRAAETFEEIAQQREYKPALINLGNIAFIKEDYEFASRYYQRVLDIETNNKSALLGIARCNHELENYGLVTKTYKQLKEIDPNMAMRFAYLDLRGEEATRAADAAGMRKVVLWEEEI